MFPYTVKYNESESDIQNNNLLYKMHQQHQNTFEQPDFFENFEIIQTESFFHFCILYKFHSSHFIFCIFFCNTYLDIVFY